MDFHVEVKGKSSTALVKYLEILPNDPVIHTKVEPLVENLSLVIEKLSNVTVQCYRHIYDNTGAQVRLLHSSSFQQ